MRAIDAAKKAGDTVGGDLRGRGARACPPGLGSFAQWDRRLDGRLAQALMSIQAVKAVALGAGFAAGEHSRARAFHDEILFDDARGAAPRQQPRGRPRGRRHQRRGAARARRW